jgi:hypothetical protein
MSSIEAQLVDSSRLLIDLVVANVGNDQKLFDEAVKTMVKDKYPISMRAARIVQFAALRHPNLLRNHIDSMILVLPISKVDGVKRSILKLFTETPVFINDDQLGRLTDCCFSFVQNPNESIAVRAFSIDILLKIIKKFPDLKPELIAILESILPDGSVGLKNKCRKLLKKL